VSPPEPAAALDALVERLDGALVVVTTAVGDERAGCLVGFHCQCSIEPRRYALWLSKANRTYRLALHAELFAVHALSADDHGLAGLFGTTSGDEVDKFAHCSWTPGPGGVPILDDCPDHVVLRRVTLLDDGSDHVCLVTEPSGEAGRRARGARGGGGPLRLSQARHLDAGHDAEERPDPAAPAAGEP
jgi:flavin reductase (DIM6/NTAB) family NADH-FMN oxidoreductase RutF